MKNEELKNCPFCGETVKIESCMGFGAQKWGIFHSCDCMNALFYHKDDYSKQQVVEMWNTRLERKNYERRIKKLPVLLW